MRRSRSPGRNALGAGLRRLRQAAGLRLPGLAIAAGLGLPTVWAVEVGVGRVPPSTLRSIAESLTAWSPQLGSAESLTSQLLGWAGPRLASEPPRTARRARRRAARRRQLLRWLDERGGRGWDTRR